MDSINYPELVSATTQLKLKAADGKRYLTDCMDMDAIRQLAMVFPNTKAMAFIDWLTNSDNSIDGQSFSCFSPQNALLFAYSKKKVVTLQAKIDVRTMKAKPFVK